MPMLSVSVVAEVTMTVNINEKIIQHIKRGGQIVYYGLQLDALPNVC